MLVLWFGINLGVINIITGFLGPLVFQLGWVDCVCIVIFANALSACAPAYMSTFGPESGNRTMVGVLVACIPQINCIPSGSLPCFPLQTNLVSIHIVEVICLLKWVFQ